MSANDKVRVRTEEDNVSLKGIVRFAIGMVVVLVLVSALLIVYFRVMVRHEARQDPVVPLLARHDPSRVPAGVRLQEQPFRDIEEQRRADSALLDSGYGWVDEKAGVVHIPIDVAMQLVVNRGLAARPAGTPAAPPPPSAEASRPDQQRHAVESPALEGKP